MAAGLVGAVGLVGDPPPKGQQGLGGSTPVPVLGKPALTHPGKQLWLTCAFAQKKSSFQHPYSSLWGYLLRERALELPSSTPGSVEAPETTLQPQTELRASFYPNPQGTSPWGRSDKPSSQTTLGLSLEQSPSAAATKTLQPSPREPQGKTTLLGWKRASRGLHGPFFSSLPSSEPLGPAGSRQVQVSCHQMAAFSPLQRANELSP